MLAFGASPVLSQDRADFAVPCLLICWSQSDHYIPFTIFVPSSDHCLTIMLSVEASTNTLTMNRRSFLASIAAAGGFAALKRVAVAQSFPADKSFGPLAKQAEAIRTTAGQFLQTLETGRRERVLFPFPKGQTPAAVGFSHMPGGFGGPRGGGGPDHVRRDFVFDTDGNPQPETGREHGPGPGGGPPGGPGGQHHGGPPAAGEKFGDAVWTNFPIDNVTRPGVRMGECTAAEREAVHRLLRVVLSPMGYQKVLDIMAADQKVADAGSDYAAGLDAYVIGLFGPPDAVAPWMLQFGGHHLGLNVVFAGDQAVCAPLHTGILPARFTAGGKIVRGLGRENDKGFDLLATFTPEQLGAATIEQEVSDLLCGPGHPTVTFRPAGLRGHDMTDIQRTMLFELAREWAGVLNDAHSAPRLEAIRASLGDTCFAWSDPRQHEPGVNGESYFRIHSPSLLIEHAPQGNQGGYKVHVHTVMRDLQNDYGRLFV